jgi:site-specific recombinase XerD
VAALSRQQEVWGDGKYVFSREDGVQFTNDGLRWRCMVVFRDADLGLLDAYSMRHTFASIMDDQGVDHRKIADMMGYKNLATF